MNRRIWIGLALAVAGVAVAAGVAARLRGTAVPVATVGEGPLQQSVVVSARVASPVRVFLGSTVTGRVAEVAARAGDALSAGQLVVRLEDAEASAALRQAEAALKTAEQRLVGQRALAAPVAAQQLAQARANADAAQRELQRQRELRAQGFIGQARLDEAERAADVARAQADAAAVQARANATGSELAQAESRVAEARAAVEAARARLAQSRIVAPADARLLQRLAEPGQIVQPGARLAELALRQRPQLVAQVDEKYLGRVQPGQTASVVADAYPGQTFPATVATIAPVIDAQRGSVEVKFDLPQPPDFLRDDMTVSVEVLTGRRERTRVLPVEALRGGDRVWLLQDGRVVERAVRTGLRSLTQVEVLDGVQPGDAVVLGGDVQPGARARPGGSAPARSAGGEAADTAVNSMGR